ncbi:MAG TPA: hypothetical protein VGJ53_08185 [Micromonosporaceae bacterium]
MREMWAGGVLGIVVGFLVGHLHARAQRARVDLTKTKEMIPGLRTTFWALFRHAAGRWLIVGSVVIAVGYVAFRTPG